MNPWFIFLGAVLLASRVFAGEVTSTCGTNLMLGSFELKDQFNTTQLLVFPRTNLLVLTVADQKGSEQIAAWVRPLKERFPHGLSIEGVADVSRLPLFLRPLVRREFKTKFERPVMLDWSGAVVKQLPCAPDVANVFLMATNGAVLGTFQGAIETNRRAELIGLIETHAVAERSPRIDAERTARRLVTER